MKDAASSHGCLAGERLRTRGARGLGLPRPPRHVGVQATSAMRNVVTTGRSPSGKGNSSRYRAVASAKLHLTGQRPQSQELLMLAAPDPADLVANVVGATVSALAARLARTSVAPEFDDDAPAGVDQLLGVSENTSCHVPAAAHTTSCSSRSGSTNTRRAVSCPNGGTPPR